MNVLKFDPTTNEYVDGKVDIGDCSFTLPNQTLPITLATAYVDGEYNDTVPYFSTYALGAAWVQSRIAAGKATAGNIIITSNQTTCNLISNVNIWLAPSVVIDTISGYVNSGVFIDGDGKIASLTLTSCNTINAKARAIQSIRCVGGSNITLDYVDSNDATIDKSNGVDITCSGSGGVVQINDESRVNFTGINSLFDSLTIDNNSSLRANGLRIVGATTIGAACFADFQDCEFYNENGVAVSSLNCLSMTNCWVHSGSDVGIKLYEGTGQGTTVLNNVIIQAFGTYSISDLSTASGNAPIYIYGNSCANKAMYHCTAMVNSLVVNSALRYKVY